MINFLRSWLVCAKDTSFSQIMQEINTNTKLDKTAESHLNHVTGFDIKTMQKDTSFLQNLNFENFRC
jgi:hypothetical protein